jgi:hypothetical protein
MRGFEVGYGLLASPVGRAEVVAVSGHVWLASVVQGIVRVTVVGVGAHCVQTVTVVVHPSGMETVVVAGPEPGWVTLAVSVTVAGAGPFPGQYVVVIVVQMVVKPVGQMSVYEVTITVVMVTGSEVDGVGVIEATLVIPGALGPIPPVREIDEATGTLLLGTVVPDAWTELDG